MELNNGLNVFFFFLAISANAISVLSHIHSPVPSIALPPNYPSASVQDSATSSASAPPPTAVSKHESAISSAPALPPTAVSKHESAMSSAPAPTPIAASKDESAMSSAPAPIAASEGESSDAMSFAAAALSATETTELVQICDVTSNPELCKSSIASHMEQPTVDPTSALKTEIKEAIKVVEGGVAKLKTLRKDGSASDEAIACYDTCLENFDLAIFDLKSGLESIDAKDTGTMESVLAAVQSNLMTCDDTFVEMGVDSPLDNISTKMSKYAANCLEISRLLM